MNPEPRPTEPTEPTDDAIASGLAAKPAKLWRQLFESIDSLGDLGQHVVWVSPVRVWLVRSVVRYPTYSESFNAVQAMLYDLGVVVPFGWSGWDGVQRYRHGVGLDTAPVADAARLCTAYLRGERFNTGVLADALTDGTFERIFARLRTWFDEHHASR
jgi:Family of unknown function (DUF6508)